MWKTYPLGHELASDECAASRDDPRKTRYEGWVLAQGFFDHGGEVWQGGSAAESDFIFFAKR